MARSIARKIVSLRSESPISSPEELAKIVESIYAKRYRKPSKKHPATRVFQALRIEVNDELEALKEGIRESISVLAPGGRIAVVSYHSLEDRIVKNIFRNESRDCLCPPEMPKCQCTHKRSIKIITRKPITTSDGEIQKNPRSRSAKLRVAEKI